MDYFRQLVNAGLSSVRDENNSHCLPRSGELYAHRNMLSGRTSCGKEQPENFTTQIDSLRFDAQSHLASRTKTLPSSILIGKVAVGS